jgi:hypothetical protein
MSDGPCWRWRWPLIGCKLYYYRPSIDLCGKCLRLRPASPEHTAALLKRLDEIPRPPLR